jgi:hypothetical protein
MNDTITTKLPTLSSPTVAMQRELRDLGSTAEQTAQIMPFLSYLYGFGVAGLVDESLATLAGLPRPSEAVWDEGAKLIDRFADDVFHIHEYNQDYQELILVYLGWVYEVYGAEVLLPDSDGVWGAVAATVTGLFEATRMAWSEENVQHVLYGESYALVVTVNDWTGEIMREDMVEAVPDPSFTDPDGGKYLRSGGMWNSPPAFAPMNADEFRQRIVAMRTVAGVSFATVLADFGDRANPYRGFFPEEEA